MIATSMSGAVALLTIDRHERRNALDTEHCLALHEAVTQAADEARVIVITGSGSAFCAGADLSDSYIPGDTPEPPGIPGDTPEPPGTGQFRTTLRALLELLGDVPVPVIAAVNGPALGAGTQLAIAADLRIVAPAARFGIPAGRLGLSVDHWTVRRLAHLVGGGTARLMLLAGEEVDAEEALQRGLAERAGDLDEARRWAGAIAELAPLTLRAHKLALERAGEEEPDDSDVVAAVRAAWASADFAEGLAAFGERRPPRFEGR